MASLRKKYSVLNYWTERKMNLQNEIVLRNQNMYSITKSVINSSVKKTNEEIWNTKIVILDHTTTPRAY